ncbi:hypothetical protein PRZ48_006299 [Zasmidium cellare]|uniref:Uncharacterized protein n=1 Tax=Zasmidium cellare TaxID=395010 RepID=A0ABR0EP46_ZASCE|nr:hypothetical protein PRZ48_006299 [Zasmidium cellare]
MGRTLDANATQPSLSEQVAQLERERDDAKSEAASLRTEVARLNQKTIDNLQVQRWRKEWQDRMTELKGSLGIANRQLQSKTEELARMKEQQQMLQDAMDEAGSVTSKDEATSEALEAMEDFLSRNKEVTGDKFFGMGRELDHLRALLAKIPVTKSDDDDDDADWADTNQSKTDDEEGIEVVVLDDDEEATASGGIMDTPGRVLRSSKRRRWS